MTACTGAFPVAASHGKGRPHAGLPRGKDTAISAGTSALQCAYRLLAYRGRSEKELRERMVLKGFDAQVIDEVIARLLSQGFLDDRKLAASLKRYACETKHLGLRGTRRFLRERGIPVQIIEETVTDIDEAEIARKIIEKKMAVLRQYPQEKILRRLCGLLSRRGYSPETIRRALSSIAAAEDPR